MNKLVFMSRCTAHVENTTNLDKMNQILKIEVKVGLSP